MPSNFARKDIYVPHLRAEVSTPLGAKAGPLLFLGSQLPIDLETGKLVLGLKDLPASVGREYLTGIQLIDIPEDRALAQTWQVLRNIQQVLATEGCSLDDVLHLRVFLQDTRDIPSVERVICSFMPRERPSATVVAATNAGTHPDIAVQMDIIASTGGEQRENASIPDLDPLTAPFPLASRAGQFLFTSSLAGVDPATGQPVNRIEDLAPEDRALTHPPHSAREEAIEAQHVTIYRHFHRIFESQGATLATIFHHHGWTLLPMREFGVISKVRSKLAAREKYVAPATAFPISAIRREGALFEWQEMALLPPKGPGDYRIERVVPMHGLAGYYAPAVKAGPFIFTAGEVSIDTNVPRLVNRFEDLPDRGVFLSYGRMHEEKPILAQAWYVYEMLRSYLEAAKLTMEDVVHQSVYMVNPADFPAVERVATLFYGAKLPATSLVPIMGTSPFMPNALLEIEVVAIARE